MFGIGYTENFLPVDPYLFPARGRKLARKPKHMTNCRRVDPYLFPARGRKLFHRLIPLNEVRKLIPTFSPQGDGNISSGVKT